MSAVEAVTAELRSLVREQAPTFLVIDFRDVRLLSTAMLGNLIDFDEKVKARGGKLVLCNLTPLIREIVHVTRLDSLFQLEDSLEAATAKCRRYRDSRSTPDTSGDIGSPT
jgi:anti-anti-sigma factor